MITRRKLLAVGAAGATAILAGCSGDGEGDSGDGGDGGADDGSGDGSGDGNGDDDGTDDGSDDGTDDGSDGTDGSDDGTDDGSDGTDGTDDGTGDDGNDDGTDDGSDGPDDERFVDVVRSTESYAMDATVETAQGTLEMSGRFYQGNIYWEFTQQGEQTELYFVGDETYFVFGGQCVQGGSQSGIDRGTVDPTAYDPESSEAANVEPTRTDTIDGEEVLVYEISDGTAQGTVTYYVLADSGYLRRIETPTGTWNFRDWNEASPVEAPDMNCQQAGG